jgi:2-methylaconitate cis-trans-isomerase PrpF
MPRDIVIEHPSGTMQVRLEQRPDQAAPVAYLVRTARRLFEGHVFVETPDASRPYTRLQID